NSMPSMNLKLTPALLLLFMLSAVSPRLWAEDKAGQPLTWIFLNAGAQRDKARSMSRELLNSMQAQHVGNFGTQFNRGTLMAAGPLGDNGLIRRIVFL